MKTGSIGSMLNIKVSFFFLFLLSTGKIYAQHQNYILDKVIHHLRIGSTPEWSDIPLQKLAKEGIVALSVTDCRSGALLPARITITNSEKAFQTTGQISAQMLAVRPGCIYTGDGKAKFGLPEGKYTIYASRGF